MQPAITNRAFSSFRRTIVDITRSSASFIGSSCHSVAPFPPYSTSTIAINTTTTNDINNNDAIITSEQAIRNPRTTTTTSSSSSPRRRRRRPTSTTKRNPTCIEFSIENPRRFFDAIAAKFGIKNHKDWYNVTVTQIHNAACSGRSVLTRHYNGSLQQALASVYPEHGPWIPWLFKKTSPGFWKDDPANHKRFFDWAAQQLGIDAPEGWYAISARQLHDLGGKSLLTNQYNGSLFSALKAAYPEYQWLPWRFRQAPQGFWHDPANHRLFFDWMAAELGIQSHEGWYGVTTDQIAKLGADCLLSTHYKHSLLTALSSVYPEYEWLPWRFVSAPQGFWKDDIANQRRFFEWAAKQLGFSSCPPDDDDGGGGDGNDDDDDEGRQRRQRQRQRQQQGAWLEQWYSVSREKIIELGGGGLLGSCYGGSLQRALVAVYPGFDWKVWRFERIHSADVTESDLRKYVEFLAKELKVEHLDDWYRASMKHIRELGGSLILEQRGGLFPVLKKLYPEHPWQEERFNKNKGKKATQRWLALVVQQLFPSHAGKEKMFTK